MSDENKILLFPGYKEFNQYQSDTREQKLSLDQSKLRLLFQCAPYFQISKGKTCYWDELSSGNKTWDQEMCIDSDPQKIDLEKQYFINGIQILNYYL